MFAARSAHDGWEQGRKDDLESLGYILLYFLASLPWMYNKSSKNIEDFIEEIRYKKNNLPLKQYGNRAPKECISYLEYSRNMEYDEDPDYEYIRRLFQHRAIKLKIKYPYDNIFDWSYKVM